MAFLAPWMLFGAVAAGIPIALHFFYRTRYRTVPWAAMKFLLTSIEQTSRRLRFQELVLLALRVLLLLLLAIAIARPATRVALGGAQAEAVDAVFIIDTSMSMAADERGASRLERAKTAARMVLDNLPPYSTVQIITSTDQALLVGPQAPSNLDHARHLLDELGATHLATDFLPALKEAGAALEKGNSVNKELYFFSDFQKRGFEEQASAATRALQELSKQATVCFVRCGTRLPRNVSIAGIVPQSAIPHTGARAAFSVVVRNSGVEAVREVHVQLKVADQELETATIPELNPGESRSVSLTARLPRAGLTLATATLGNDELDADNRFDLLLDVRDRVNVLIVDGALHERDPEKTGSYFLLNALRPVAESVWDRYHIRPQVVGPGQATAEALDGIHACILANVSLQPGSEGGTPGPEFLDRLVEFVRGGGTLLICGGPNVSDGARRSPEAYNRLLHAERRLLPARLQGDYRVSPDQPVRLDPASIDPGNFLAAFREEPLDALGQVEIQQALALEKLDEAQPAERLEAPLVALRFTNGLPAVITRRVGEGEVILVTTSADRRWTDWPIRQTFLPFVHVTLGYVLRGRSERHNLTAGEPIVWRAPSSAAGKAFVLVRPDGQRVRLGEPAFADERPLLSAPDTGRAGVYHIRPEMAEARSGDEVAFALTPDLREVADMEALSANQMDERFGFQGVHMTAGDDVGGLSAAERSRREWTLWALTALLLLTLGESLLAWWCGRGW